MLAIATARLHGYGAKKPLTKKSACGDRFSSFQDSNIEREQCCRGIREPQ